MVPVHYDSKKMQKHANYSFPNFHCNNHLLIEMEGKTDKLLSKFDLMNARIMMLHEEGKD